MICTHPFQYCILPISNCKGSKYFKKDIYVCTLTHKSICTPPKETHKCQWLNNHSYKQRQSCIHNPYAVNNHFMVVDKQGSYEYDTINLVPSSPVKKNHVQGTYEPWNWCAKSLAHNIDNMATIHLRFVHFLYRIELSVNVSNISWYKFVPKR